MICARLLNGLGTGILNAIIPVYASEISPPATRGSFIAQEFTLNIFGVCSAYWLSYTLSLLLPSTSAFLWRFPIAFQIVPLVVLFFSVWIFPESPRWLAKIGREGEGRWILGRLRGEDGRAVDVEWSGVVAEVEVERKNAGAQNYLTMFFGTGEGSEGLHIGRRVQLVIWLQVMQEWIGIAGVTIYAPTIFRIAGINNRDSGWVSGLNNTVYMVRFLPSRYIPIPLIDAPFPNHNPINKPPVLNPHLRLHSRRHRPPYDPLLGFHRHGHIHVRSRNLLSPQYRKYRCRCQNIRHRSRLLHFPIHGYFRCDVAYSAVALSGRDIPTGSESEGKCVGGCGVEFGEWDVDAFVSWYVMYLLFSLALCSAHG